MVFLWTGAGVTKTPTPAFASGTTSYALTSEIWNNGGGATTIFYRFITGFSLATVQVLDSNPGGYPSYTTITSQYGGGEYAVDLYLNDGNNTQYIKVTAQDGTTTRTYQFTIFKQAQGQEGFDYGYAAVQYWTVPAGVTSISMVCIGAGGAGGKIAAYAYNKAVGGGGGGLSYGNNISVTAGQVLTVYSGAPGSTWTSGSGAGGGSSYVTMPTQPGVYYCLSSGGSGGTISASTVALSGGAGGTSGGTGRTGGSSGGAGGTAGISVSNGNTTSAAWLCTGGGGAGGYTGAGGAGGNTSSSGGLNGAAGTGGAGGGGGGNNAPNRTGVGTGYYNASGAGGGVYITGAGSSGAGGQGSNSLGTGYANGGGGGSSGTDGGNGGSTYNGSVDVPSPGLYGGGGASGYYAGAGGQGAVRIIWPGLYRSYPATNVVDV